jgi:hypothetical protein
MYAIKLSHEKRKELDKERLKTFESIESAIDELNYMHDLWVRYNNSIIHRTDKLLIVKENAFDEQLSYEIQYVMNNQ